MRRFELQEGTSHKFWEISIAGDTLAVRYGKVGTQGQSQVKSFKSDTVAQRAVEKLIAEQLGRGYVEVAASQPKRGPAPAAKAPAATRVLLRDGSGHEVVLLLAGKRFGIHEDGKWRVVTFSSTAAAKDHHERLLFMRGKEGLKPVETTPLSAGQAEAELERGIEDFDGNVEVRDGRGTITFEGSSEHDVPVSACKGLVKWMARESLRSVQLVCDFASPKQSWARALQGAALPDLKAFILDTPFQTETRQTDNSVGDLAAVLAACPHLERLYAVGNLALGPVRHESLRELYLIGNPLTPALLKGVGGCEFPRLERLALSLHSESEPPSPKLWVQALRTLRAPVSEVHIDRLHEIGPALEELASQGLPPGVRVLSLNGFIGDDDEPETLRALLQRHASAFAALEVLGLPGDAEVGGTPVRTGSAEQYQSFFGTTVYETW